MHITFKFKFKCVFASRNIFVPLIPLYAPQRRAEATRRGRPAAAGRDCRVRRGLLAAWDGGSTQRYGVTTRDASSWTLGPSSCGKSPFLLIFLMGLTAHRFLGLRCLGPRGRR